MRELIAAAAPRGKHASDDPEVRKFESEEAELKYFVFCAVVCYFVLY